MSSGYVLQYYSQYRVRFMCAHTDIPNKHLVLSCLGREKSLLHTLMVSERLVTQREVVVKL